MEMNRKRGRAASIPEGLISGTATSMVLTVGISLLGAVMISSEWMEHDTIGIWSMVTLIASAMAGSVIAAGRIKRLRMQMALVNGGIYFLMLLCLTALLFGGQYGSVGITSVLIGIGSVVGGVVANSVSSDRRSRKRRKMHC